MSWDEESFLEKLDGAHEFPESYVFKFIVKSENKGEVEALLPEAHVKLKPSSGNKYVSVTLTQIMKSSQDVVEIYKRADEIEGIMFKI